MQTLLGERAVAVFAGATMHTPVDVTERALAVVHEKKIDGVVAVGGGSTTGLGKATPNGSPSGAVLAANAVAPASGNPIYETLTKPTVTIGGLAAPVLFSGIAPGTAGEYQIDFQVPTGVPEGDAVPLTVSMPGSTTGAATLAIHSR